MGEIIQIHVGQAGVQIANACWELYCLEHGINPDGTLCDCPCDNTFTNFFDFKSANKVVPRAILVDSEPTVIDQVRTGPYGRLYSPHSLITGKEDSGSNFARGYFTMGSELIDITMEAVRNLAESCSNLRGFLIFRSIGGGTGSGLGNLIAEQLLTHYDKIAKMEFVIFPSPSLSPLIVEPYNALLATHLGMDSIECSCIIDNEALYDICSRKLNINAPKYKNLNRIIGQTASNFTTSHRFAGSSNVTFSEFQTNLVPYPRIHFPVVSYSPFIPGTGSGYVKLSTEQITTACYESSNQLVRCNPVEGKYMTSVLLYRGDVSPSDINSSISRLRATDTIRFVDWSPTGFKVGTNKEVPFSVPGGGIGNTNKSLVVLSNNTVIKRTWCRLIDKYDRLYSRRAFIHHYISEGLEEGSLAEASEDICSLISDYREAENAGNADDSRSGRRGTQYDGSFRKSGLSRGEGISPGSFERTAGVTGLYDADDRSPRSTRSTRNQSTEASSNLPSGSNYDSNQNTRRTQRVASDSDLFLPRLPGLQSLNYIFGDSENLENGNVRRDNSNSRGKSPGPGKCNCQCNTTEYHDDDDADNLSGGFSNNSSKTSVRTQILVGRPKSDDSMLSGSKRAVTLSRSKKSLNDDEEEDQKSLSLKKTISFQEMRSRNKRERSLPQSKKRSKSHEPKKADGLRKSRKLQSFQSFDQGFDTEAFRAKEKFSITSPHAQFITGGCMQCCPGGVLRLPPPRPEGQENLGEALSAKERFCNSTCQPQSCEPVCCTVVDPCSHQSYDNQNPSCSYQVMYTDPCANPQITPYCSPNMNQGMMWMGGTSDCCRKPKGSQCFCCQEDNPLRYQNSDDKIVVMCRRQRKRELPDWFCGHEIGGGLNVLDTSVMPMPCYPSSGVCFQENAICYPNNDAICDSSPTACEPAATSSSQCVESETICSFQPRIHGALEEGDTSAEASEEKSTTI